MGKSLVVIKEFVTYVDLGCKAHSNQYKLRYRLRYLVNPKICIHKFYLIIIKIMKYVKRV